MLLLSSTEQRLCGIIIHSRQSEARKACLCDSIAADCAVLDRGVGTILQKEPSASLQLGRNYMGHNYMGHNYVLERGVGAVLQKEPSAILQLASIIARTPCGLSQHRLASTIKKSSECGAYFCRIVATDVAVFKMSNDSAFMIKSAALQSGLNRHKPSIHCMRFSSTISQAQSMGQAASVCVGARTDTKAAQKTQIQSGTRLTQTSSAVLPVTVQN